MVRVLRVSVSTYCPFFYFCPRCYVSYNLRTGVFKPSTISVDVFVKALEKFKPEWVALGGGEPLLESLSGLTCRLAKIARGKGVNVEVTSSVPSVKSLSRVIGFLNHLQISYGLGRFTSNHVGEAVKVARENGVSYGFNVLLTEEVLDSGLGFFREIIGKYKPHVLVTILPRIFRLSGSYVRRFFRMLPMLFLECLENNVRLGLDCVSARILGLNVEEGLTLLPDGRVVLCSTYPNISSHSECPDLKYYLHRISGKHINTSFSIFQSET